MIWNKDATLSGKRARVFCASMADVFEDRRDLDGRREQLWKLIGQTPSLNWLLLTKRPENVKELVPWKETWPDNVWLGSTAENQEWLLHRLPQLEQIPAKVRFLSCEPLLGPIDLTEAGVRNDENRPSIDWIIGGGESGHGARPMHPEWIESLRDQCLRLDIRFHFKQWGNWRPVSHRSQNISNTRDLPARDGGVLKVENVGKKTAGRRLGNRTWDEFPR